MWIIAALFSACFAGASSVFAKAGVKETDSDIATAIRTAVVLVFSWLLVAVTGSLSQITTLPAKECFFLVLSGLSTGMSWLCFFKALSLGPVNKVLPVDKLNIVLTFVIGITFFSEALTWNKCAGLALSVLGTFLMIQSEKPTSCSPETIASKKPTTSHIKPHKSTVAWLAFALLAGTFASLTSVLGKMSLQNIDSNLATALRTIVILLFATAVVLAKKKGKLLAKTPRNELVFVVLSGVATGLSWLCYFAALQAGPVSVVAPMDKLSTVFAVLFAALFLKERLYKKNSIGLFLLLFGTLLML